MRERKREVVRELESLEGAVVRGRWGLTDKGGGGVFWGLPLAESGGGFFLRSF